MSAGAHVNDEDSLVAIARDMRTVAVVGIKDDSDPDAPAYTIPSLIQDSGVRVIGVNPRVAAALGEPTLRSLAELPPGVDVLDVFRRSDAIPEIADELLALPLEKRPAVVWLQTGVRNDAAAERLAAAGIKVVQDACLGVLVARYR